MINEMHNSIYLELPNANDSALIKKKNSVGNINVNVDTFFFGSSVVLWLGDLNYRISDLEVERVKQLIKDKDFQTLYKYDQVKTLITHLVQKKHY